MRAVDLFLLAVASLFALATMTVEAWSPEWWVLVVVAATIALASFAHMLGRKNLSAYGPWLLIIGAPIAGLIWLYLSHRPQPVEPIEGNIFVSCQMTFMPEVMPAEGRLEVIALSPEALQNAGGKVPISGRSGAPGSRIDWPKGWFGKVPSGWRCEITNDTSSALLEVAIPVRITYGTKSSEHGGDYNLVSIRIDPGPGSRRTIYLYNKHSEGGSMLISKIASPYKLGENVRRPIRVEQPVEQIHQIVFLFPFTLPEQPPVKQK